MTPSLDTFLTPLPLIAVLRGITPTEIDTIGDALVGEGFRILEVPLNSPQPLDSIGRLATRYPQCLVGAGTVLRLEDIARVAGAGGKLIVTPHGNPRLIAEAKRQGLVCVPGVATPTEAFAALDAGADGLKMFPAEQLTPAVLKAWRAVLPKATLVFPVGGMRPDNLMGWWQAGANGFGTGSNLYQPGAAPDEVRAIAVAFAETIRSLPQR
ncbi:MAG: 2-dehydro-3-deoxy-6-phosphogalactonate aldolase [Pseudomonadota bacterium]|nr:2-dehydro-3-deoxy-6-phosphogalactonate aldolase [Pseudomonadota bacterium]